MNAKSQPDAPSVANLESVAEIVEYWLPRHASRTAIRFDDGQRYRDLDYAAYLENARRMINYFASAGAEQRVVATFVKNRPEWDMTAFGSLYTGNILFPLDTGMNDEELTHLLSSNPPDYLLVSPAQRARIKRILAALGQRPRILIADLYRVYEDRDAGDPADLDENETRLSALPPSPPGLPAPGSRLDDPRTVLAHYATSGTTSLPKIVRITHQNILAQVREAQGVINLRRNEDLLNIGSYTHIATLLEFLVAKSKGFTVTYFTRDADQDDVLEDEIKKLKKQGVRIKALMAVPKFWVYVMKEVLEELKNKPVLSNLYRYLTSIEKNAGLHDIGTVDKAKLVAVRRSFRNKMGGYFTYGVSSSSKIDPGVVEIFSKLGVTVIDIYGATEASGIIARNKLNESRRGSCGRLISGIQARLDNLREIPGFDQPVGELCIQGPTVSAGYLGREPGAHLDRQGFYRTGDLAYIDRDNYVFLLGRQKELIRWDDGTYIDPMHLSNLLVRSIWINDALVTRLGRDDHLSVFIYPDWKRIENDKHYQERLNLGLTPAQALQPLLEEAVNHTQSLARITPKLSTEKIYILKSKLQRTPTHKIKLAHELARLDLTSYISKPSFFGEAGQPRP
jgi:long-chain acyl-CoA synthetase